MIHDEHLLAVQVEDSFDVGHRDRCLRLNEAQGGSFTIPVPVRDDFHDGVLGYASNARILHSESAATRICYHALKVVRNLVLCYLEQPCGRSSYQKFSPYMGMPRDGRCHSQSAVDGFDGACRETGSERLLEVRETAHTQAISSPIYRAQRERLFTPPR